MPLTGQHVVAGGLAVLCLLWFFSLQPHAPQPALTSISPPTNAVDAFTKPSLSGVSPLLKGPVDWRRLLPAVDLAAERGLQRELRFYVSNVEKIARALAVTEPQPAPKYVRPDEAHALLPEYVMILGLEGVGHHGIVHWLETLAFLTGRVPLRNALYYTESPLSRGNKLDDMTKEFSKVGRAVGRPVVPVVWFSFPCRTWGRNLTRCEADYAACFDKIAAVTGIYRVANNYEALHRTQASVKFILLDRSFAASSWSHKDWDGGLEPHARLMALYKRYLSAQVAALPSPLLDWANVRYESLCQTGTAQLEVARRITNFLNWQVSDHVLRQSLENAFWPSSKDALAEMSDSQVHAIAKLYATHGPHWTAFKDTATRLDKRDWAARDESALQAAIASRASKRDVNRPKKR